MSSLRNVQNNNVFGTVQLSQLLEKDQHSHSKYSIQFLFSHLLFFLENL